MRPYHQGPPTSHFDGRRFFNPGQLSTDRSLREMLRWKLGARPAPWPAWVETPQARPAPAVPGLRVTFVGHASFLVQAAGHNILVDPVWSPRASPLRLLGPKRVTRPGIAWADLPPIHTVLLTHSHYDHMDRHTLARLLPQRPRVIAPLGNDAVLARACPGLAVETGDWGDRFALAPGVTVTLHPAHHWSARSPFDARMALWCGFVLHSGPHTTYIAGDTALGDGAIFRDLRATYGTPGLAILPIGAYEPRWFMRAQHANPAEAVEILQLTGAAMALGVHWGTFRLTDEARDAPPAALAVAMQAASLPPGRFLPAQPGQVWDAP